MVSLFVLHPRQIGYRFRDKVIKAVEKALRTAEDGLCF